VPRNVSQSRSVEGPTGAGTTGADIEAQVGISLSAVTAADQTIPVELNLQGPAY